MDRSGLTTDVYAELRALAERCFRGQPREHTLQPTALVSEAWLKLGDSHDVRDRSHFVALAATAMRQVLIDHARARASAKRGGAWKRVTLSGRPDDGIPPVDVLELDDALDRLATVDPRQARIIELRFFGGLGAPEIADVVGLSRRAVELDLRMAKAWLARELAEAEPGDV